jgi:hypothetical protein
MEGLELLKYWKVAVINAISETFLHFRRDRQLFLTENDIKCFLYN